jgi:hypothetical protein
MPADDRAPFALTVICNEHRSGGPGPVLLKYDQVVANTLRPDQWDGQRLEIPQDGIYLVSLSMVTDVVGGATFDDVHVEVRLKRGAADYKPTGLMAWKPHSIKRGTGSVSGALDLKRGDLIDTMITSGGNNAERFLQRAWFSVARIN